MALATSHNRATHHIKNRLFNRRPLERSPLGRACSTTMSSFFSGVAAQACKLWLRESAWLAFTSSAIAQARLGTTSKLKTNPAVGKPLSYFAPHFAAFLRLAVRGGCKVMTLWPLLTVKTYSLPPAIMASSSSCCCVGKAPFTNWSIETWWFMSFSTQC